MSENTLGILTELFNDLKRGLADLQRDCNAAHRSLSAEALTHHSAWPAFVSGTAGSCVAFPGNSV